MNHWANVNQILYKLPFVEGDSNCSNEGPYPLEMGANQEKQGESRKIGWGSNLHERFLRYGRFKFVQRTANDTLQYCFAVYLLLILYKLPF